MMGKCLLVTTHYLPLDGGAQTVYDALAGVSVGQIGILTARRDSVTGDIVAGADAFDAAVSYPMHRISRMRPPLLHVKPGFGARAISWLKARFIAYSVVRAVARIVRTGGYDSVCIGALDSLGWLIEPVRKRLKVPVLLYTHGEEISQAAYSRKADVRRMQYLQSADAVIAVSSFTAALIEEKYAVAPDRIHVLTNGVDYQRFAAAEPDASLRGRYGLTTGPLVLAMGRLVRRKGFDRLLQAWPLVRARVPDAQLAIGGAGPLKDELTQGAAVPELAGSVTMLGRVPDADLPGLYASADVFTMPNRMMEDGDTEGFGLVFLEAAAAGTPSVGGNAGGVPDAIEHGVTGLLVDGNDPQAIADALTSLLADRARRNTMAAAARLNAEKARWSNKINEFRDILAAARRHAGAPDSSPDAPKADMGEPAQEN